MSSRPTVIEIPTPEGDYISPHRGTMNRALLEFCGMTLFVYISLAGVSQTILAGNGDQIQIALCFALGLTTGIIVSSPSGAHLNPAVSMTVFLTDETFSLVDLLSYISAQMLGAFVAALLVFAVYSSRIADHPDEMFLGAFGTVKSSEMNLLQSIIDQFLGTALLMLGIAMTPSSWTQPLTIGAVLGGLGLFQGSNGFGLNPARDLGPRLVSSIVFGSAPFTAENHWFWVPLIVPFFGAPFGWLISVGLKHLRD